MSVSQSTPGEYVAVVSCALRCVSNHCARLRLWVRLRKTVAPHYAARAHLRILTQIRTLCSMSRGGIELQLQQDGQVKTRPR